MCFDDVTIMFVIVQGPSSCNYTVALSHHWMLMTSPLFSLLPSTSMDAIAGLCQMKKSMGTAVWRFAQAEVAGYAFAAENLGQLSYS